jgi:N-acyl-D-aspartate/D-glutamate deacylase
VAIRGGRIAAVGKLRDARATRTIDATGLVVAPGFVDMHNHSDDSLLVDGDGQSMIRQGVTTVVLGEGGSAAPSARFKDFASYFAALLKSGSSLNVGSYVGSSQLWTQVRGEKAGPPTRDELERMRALVRQAMEDGAFGVASSLTGPPGAWIDTETLIAMCEAAAPYGGSYSTHNRNEGSGVFNAVAEAIEIGRRAHVPVDVIHLKISEHSLWGKMPKLIEMISVARAEGAEVQANVYPYRAGQNDLAAIIPPWAHEGGSAAMIKRLEDPTLRPRLEKEILNGLPAGTTTTPPPARGRGCCWSPSATPSTSASRASA